MPTMTKIAAIDPATRCGWKSRTSHGVWDLRPKRDESGGMRLIRFKAKFLELLTAEKINLVVFERPGGRNTGAIITHSELISIIKTVCEEHGIEYRAYSASEIKKFATGKGNANKSQMIEAARSKFSYNGSDDNEADAICLYHLALSEYKNAHLSQNGKSRKNT